MQQTMTTMNKEFIGVEEFMLYKPLNKEVLPQLKKVVESAQLRGNMTHGYKASRGRGSKSMRGRKGYYVMNRTKKQGSQGGRWRSQEKQQKTNWLLEAKLKRDENEVLYAKYRNILNKMSASNFNILASELINLEIKSSKQLEKLVEVIFSKALVEIKYSEIYAKLCRELASYYIERDEKTYFRELLLNKCQRMFNKAVSLTLDEGGELKDSIFKYKSGVMGCMTFIGELYNYEMLTKKIIYSCFFVLLTNVDLNKAYTIDCMCILMSTVGRRFNKDAPNETIYCFKKFEDIKKKEGLAKRDVFAIMDLLDLRKKSRW